MVSVDSAVKKWVPSVANVLARLPLLSELLLVRLDLAMAARPVVLSGALSGIVYVKIDMSAIEDSCGEPAGIPL
jgi:hypothetical protein